VPLTIRLRRLAYRIAHRLLRVWWFVAQPDVSGVQCILTHGDRVLLVRHTYGPDTWDLPGGTMKRGERPLDTARREMAEELGLDTNGWREVGTLTGRVDRRRDTMHCFAVDLATPALTIERGEIDEVRWFERDQLPPKLGRYVKRILAMAWKDER
jgi:8-oxo-dGTP pyrophosphatase MutT (NUDIX family)